MKSLNNLKKWIFHGKILQRFKPNDERTIFWNENREYQIAHMTFIFRESKYSDFEKKSDAISWGTLRNVTLLRSGKSLIFKKNSQVLDTNVTFCLGLKCVWMATSTCANFMGRSLPEFSHLRFSCQITRENFPVSQREMLAMSNYNICM